MISEIWKSHLRNILCIPKKSSCKSITFSQNSYPLSSPFFNFLDGGCTDDIWPPIVWPPPIIPQVKGARHPTSPTNHSSWRSWPDSACYRQTWQDTYRRDHSKSVAGTCNRGARKEGDADHVRGTRVGTLTTTRVDNDGQLPARANPRVYLLVFYGRARSVLPGM